MRKKNVESSEEDEILFDDDGLPIEGGKETEKIIREKEHFYKKKKSTLLNKIGNLFQRKKDNIPMTFNIVLSSLLFLCYLSIMIVSVPTAPSLLIIIIPTLYIIIRHIKLEREQLGEKYG